MGALRNPRAACSPAKPAPTITICGALAKACSAILDLLKNPVFLCFSFITAIVPCVRQQSQCFNTEDMQLVSFERYPSAWFTIYTYADTSSILMQIHSELRTLEKDICVVSAK